MKAERLMGQIVYGSYRQPVKEYQLNSIGDTFFELFLDEADKPFVENINDIYKNMSKDPSLVDETNVEFIRTTIKQLLVKALHNFRDQTLALGKDGLNGMQDTFHLEFFLQHYLNDWEHDDRVLRIDDYDRYLDPIEREDFIENNPNYEEWMATDENEIKVELDAIYAELIDESWENFIEDTEW